MTDLINHPDHYVSQSVTLEPIDFCERLPFCLGNALKYCFRAGHKEGASEKTDLRKALWYIRRSDSPDGGRWKLFGCEPFFLTALRKAPGVVGSAAITYFYHKEEYGDFFDSLQASIQKRLQELGD